MMGLCLLHGGAGYDLRFPLYFCRPVYKFLLGRPVHFADYAYVDEEKYKNMMKLVSQVHHGLSSKKMALITSDYGMMCSLRIKWP